MSTFHNERTVTTRKPHRCEWCGREIPAGFLAVYSAGKFNGDFYTRYAHPACEQLAEELDMFDPDWGLDADGWRQGVLDAYDNIGLPDDYPRATEFEEKLATVMSKYVFNK